jgi:hypothetical protein
LMLIIIFFVKSIIIRKCGDSDCFVIHEAVRVCT